MCENKAFNESGARSEERGARRKYRKSVDLGLKLKCLAKRNNYPALDT
jgi:hypothetical protein